MKLTHIFVFNINLVPFVLKKEQVNCFSICLIHLLIKGEIIYF